ncbi:MAG: hypothetical protein K9M81_01435 [Chthoniobacterales bacterium]|nr:hypothetical protein [Chthoniobacterales bacterium]
MIVLKYFIPFFVLFSIARDDLQAQELKASPLISYVSVEKYCSFLNALAASDECHLYSSEMENDQITRLGRPGFYTYYYSKKKALAPISDITGNAALLFCIWAESGAPSQIPSIDSMEHGADELGENNLVTVNQDTTHLLISEENKSHLKEGDYGSCKMSFWGSPKIVESFSKSLPVFNGAIEREYCDPRLQSNIIGCALKEFEYDAVGADFFSHDHEQWLGAVSLLSLVAFGAIYCSGRSFHCNNRADHVEHSASKDEASKDICSHPTGTLNVSFGKISLLESIVNDNSISQEDFPANHRYSSYKDITGLQDTLQRIHENFLLHGSLNPVDGAKIAAENASLLRARANAINQRILQGEREKEFARSKDHIFIDQQISILKKIADRSMRASEAYSAISWIDKETPERCKDFQNELLKKSIDIQAARGSLKYIFRDLSLLHQQAIRESFDKIFIHTGPIAPCKNLINTASASNCSSGSIKDSALVEDDRLSPLQHSSLRLATNQSQICGLKDFQLFVEKERGLSRNSWTSFYYQRNPLLNTFAWRTFASFITALKSQVFFTDHVSPAASIAMNYTVMTVGDYTSCYRQFPLDQEEASLADSDSSASQSTFSSMMGEFYTRVRSGEYFRSPVFYSMIWNFYRTVFSVTRNYPGNFFHDHFSAFIGAAWVTECVDDLTRGWRQHQEGAQERNSILQIGSPHEEGNKGEVSKREDADRLMEQALSLQGSHGVVLKNDLLTPAAKRYFSFHSDDSPIFRSSTKDPSSFPDSVENQHEICGLVSIDELFLQLNRDALVNSNKRIVGNDVTVSFQNEEAPIHDEERGSFSRGINLVRLGIYKKFGIGAIQRFDNQFQIKIRAQNPLMINELQTFFISQKEKFKESYFISPVSRFNEQEEIPQEMAHWIIKSSGRKIHFNPFYHEEFLDAINDENETLEGISEARESLHNIFKDLKPFHQRDIITNFNARFTPSGKTYWRSFIDPSWKEEPLTVEVFRSFINEQREQGQQRWTKIYYDFISNPYLCSGLWNTCTVTSAAVRIYFFSHNLAVSTIIVMAVNIPGDLTGRYRQIPRE